MRCFIAQEVPNSIVQTVIVLPADGFMRAKEYA